MPCCPGPQLLQLTQLSLWGRPATSSWMGPPSCWALHYRQSSIPSVPGDGIAHCVSLAQTTSWVRLHLLAPGPSWAFASPPLLDFPPPTSHPHCQQVLNGSQQPDGVCFLLPRGLCTSCSFCFSPGIQSRIPYNRLQAKECLIKWFSHCVSINIHISNLGGPGHLLPTASRGDETEQG